MRLHGRAAPAAQLSVARLSVARLSVALLSVAILSGVALAGCTSGTAARSSTGASSPAPSPSVTVTDSVAPPAPTSPAPTSPAPTSPVTSATGPTTTAPASSADVPPATVSASGSAPAQPLAAGCAVGGLRLSVVKQASATQHAFADLRLTNTGTSTCTLDGFPGVSLTVDGHALGSPATRAATTVAPLELAAGQTGHAQLSVLTSCNAASSDTVHVIPPNQTVALTAPLHVFGCAMTIEPYTAS